MPSAVIAAKYARALFEAAQEEGIVDRVGAEMASLSRLREEDPAFLNFLVSPEVLTEHKLEFIGTVFAPRVCPLLANFLRLLVDKGRIQHLSEMCGEYQRLAEEHEGILRAQVFTAVPLASDQELRLKAELDRITGKRTTLQKRVDPTLLGGVVVHLGNKIIDRSLRHGLRQLGEKLVKAEVG